MDVGTAAATTAEITGAAATTAAVGRATRSIGIVTARAAAPRGAVLRRPNAAGTRLAGAATAGRGATAASESGGGNVTGAVRAC